MTQALKQALAIDSSRAVNLNLPSRRALAAVHGGNIRGGWRVEYPRCIALPATSSLYSPFHCKVVPQEAVGIENFMHVKTLTPDDT